MLKSFDQLDKENDAQSIYKDYATVSQSPDGQGYAPVPAPTAGDTVAAAFGNGNTIVSMMNRKDLGLDNHDDGQYNYPQYIKDHGMEQYGDTFAQILNTKLADATVAQIQMEDQHKKTLDASGWAGTAASLAAGVFDAPTLIPGATAVRGVKGGWLIGKSMLAGGASAMAAAAGSEALLQASQITRTPEESMINIGTAGVIGSLLGGSVAALLSKSERAGAAKAIEKIADINSGKEPNLLVDNTLEGGGASGGAAINPDIAPKSIDLPKTRDDLSVTGKAAGFVAKNTAFNPVLRGTQYYASSARQLSATLFDQTIYRGLHDAGDTVGPTVEAMSRTPVQALQAQASIEAEQNFKAMVAGGTKMSKGDFYDSVGQAMRNNDENSNPFIARTATSYRKVFDHFTDQALKLGMLKEGDLDVKTASSYFSRMYNRDRLLATEPEFLDTIGRHFAERMQGAYAEDGAKLTEARNLHSQRLNDLSQVGNARAQRIADIKAQGNALDAANAHLNEHIDNVAEGNSLIRANGGANPIEAESGGYDAASMLDRINKNAESKQLAEANVQKGRDLIAKAHEQAGPALQDYLDKSAELRSRLKNLTTKNPDAQIANGEALSERIDGMQDITERSLGRFSQRTRNILNELKADPVTNAEEKWQAVTKDVASQQAKIKRVQDYIEQLKNEGADPARFVFHEQRMADQSQKLTELMGKLDRREQGVDAAKDRVKALDELMKSVTSSQAERDLRRGGQMRDMQLRAAKLTPEAVAERAAKLNDHNLGVLTAHEEQFDAKWGPRMALGLEKNEPYNFQVAGHSAAKEIYNSLTGRDPERSDSVPSYVTKVRTGPLKDRTFMVPDQLLTQHGWLKNDVREVANRYSRSMAGDIELTRRFGRADMRDQLKSVAQEYTSLRAAVEKAQSLDEVHGILGDNSAFKAVMESARASTTGYGLADAKLAAQKALSTDETTSLTDIKAGRDMFRGSYGGGVNGTNFASITRSLMGFNYLTRMGGVLLANISDFYRPAMVHGLGLYLSHLPGLMAQAFGKGSEGLQLSLKEARMAGLTIERVTHSMMQANGDLLDPFLNKTTHVERFMQKATGLASRWNLINNFTDAQQAISSVMSQHRILEAVLGNKGDGTFLHSDGDRLIRMLGISKDVQSDMVKLYAAHGEELDGFKIPNTDKWLEAANATGNPEEIARAENAVMTYRAALNTDVNSLVSKRGAGDAPLWAHGPAGKLLTQFSGYAMGAHSRVMIRGLQESPARLVGGLAALTALGTMTSYLQAWRGGKDRFDKYVADTTANPLIAIGNGLDNSGFFPVLFDIANRVERISGATGYNYKFNPIKSPLAALDGGQGSATSAGAGRASDSAGAYDALLGPTAGTVASGVAAVRVGLDKANNVQPTKHDINQAIAGVPFQSYYGIREIIQAMQGNSPYMGK